METQTPASSQSGAQAAQASGAQAASAPAQPLVHDISATGAKKGGNGAADMPMKTVLIVFISVIIAGIASGFGASYLTTSAAGSQSTENASGTETLSGDDSVVESAGIADKDTFSDSAEGKLEEKTEDDFLEEGSYKLIRPGGESQTVHLTSSTVDMSEYVGKEVRVYGETFASEKVGWLMDVGFIEVLK